MTDETKQIIDMMKELFGTLSEKIDISNDGLREELTELKNSMGKVESSMEDNSRRLTKLETALENVTDKNIALLAEGYSYLSEKINALDSMPEKLDEIQADVAMIKDVVSGHSAQINRLSKAN